MMSDSALYFVYLLSLNILMRCILLAIYFRRLSLCSIEYMKMYPFFCWCSFVLFLIHSCACVLMLTCFFSLLLKTHLDLELLNDNIILVLTFWKLLVFQNDCSIYNTTSKVWMYCLLQILMNIHQEFEF